MKTQVIGTGVGGLAAAIRLAAAGSEVDVWEANSYAGGKLSEVWCGNYRFDVGPSVFTLPFLVEDLFELSGLPRHDFKFKKLDITCRYFWEDGTEIVGWADPKRFAQEVAEKLNVAESVLHQRFAYSERIYQNTKSVFLEQSLHILSNYFRKDVAYAIANIQHLTLFSTMNEVNSATLQHPKLVQLFNRYATFNGSSPFLASGVLNSIAHLEHGIGVFAPEGGMYAITKSLEKLAQHNGAKLHYNNPVKKILHQNKRVQGIQLENESIHFGDAIVSNMDVFPTYKRLLGDEVEANKEFKKERSLSAIVFYWGINREFPNLDVHNTFFSQNYELEFVHLIKKCDICDDPTIYVNIGSKYAPDDAPKNSETWFVMVNAPANSGQDWDELVARTRKNVVAKLNRMLGIDIESMIEEEMHFDPRIIEQRNSTYQGSIYGTSSNDKMAAFFRHPNFSPTYKNLFFAGTSAHPGGGIPLCLLSGKIASELALKKA